MPFKSPGGVHLIIPELHKSRRWPTAVSLAAGTAGLTKDSAALCHQVTTLDRSKLVQRLGALDSQTLARVNIGLKAALQLS
jgi:mRNA-degrading endonuclease toxin of MazEF toxin-antitoxin module